jgi:hypothetical protein
MLGHVHPHTILLSEGKLLLPEPVLVILLEKLRVRAGRRSARLHLSGARFCESGKGMLRLEI